jgi:pyruvate dehydrogenase E1 component alpha subunit/2-oxoisovalerate dehydrogenase E1 component alpha subunit
MDERLLALQRQGRIGFYGEARGQEGSVIGSAAATRPDDWILPALREAGAGIFRGMPLSAYIAQIFGTGEDPCKGRQMPCHPCDKNVNYVVMSSCVSTQIPHAVGIAMAMKMSGDLGKCVIGYMGDGGTSEADFHVAMNFAGVTQAPVVLFCQNNQWAISVPAEKQTASGTIAIKARAYGFPGIRIDGNDAVAVYEAAKEAVDRARRGGGPTFIESLTYRIGAHSSSDDPSRYRDPREVEKWVQRDPIEHLRKMLRDAHVLSAQADEKLKAELQEQIARAVTEAEAAGPPALETMFEDVYATDTPALAEQREEYARTVIPFGHVKPPTNH